jgi:hypothetical protein
MRWTLGATAQYRHRLDMMTTSISPLSLRATVREPLGLFTYYSVKRPRRDCWSVGNSTVPAVQEEEEVEGFKVKLLRRSREEEGKVDQEAEEAEEQRTRSSRIRNPASHATKRKSMVLFIL